MSREAVEELAQAGKSARLGKEAFDPERLVCQPVLRDLPFLDYPQNTDSVVVKAPHAFP